MSRLWQRLTRDPEDGMSTAEYAVGTIAAVGFAGVLFKVVTSSKIQASLTGLIDKGFVSELARRPGQKEERFRHTMSDDLDPADVPAGAEMPAVAVAGGVAVRVPAPAAGRGER